MSTFLSVVAILIFVVGIIVLVADMAYLLKTQQTVLYISVFIVRDLFFTAIVAGLFMSMSLGLKALQKIMCDIDAIKKD
ncbi:MAG: hypothetical protein HN833_00065 [Elusimicrobiaceae bacterium]|nr:hypothetical protein [Elusimicrobiaceae bacterium]MBT3955227.1 hypothetical protein [Elusimicrobiaceae bacterium]MBT4007796.1 hypothetical protein [Elusimicrobiaceae bacterium]MBT4403325.1 hypothetical protein [Elusimicrobiaceae bacterium]MBT4440369.1 hypothetical protein [Elusimicrobiaceae bacterium]